MSFSSNTSDLLSGKFWQQEYKTRRNEVQTKKTKGRSIFYD